MFSLLIKNGFITDGTGSRPYQADLAVSKAQIALIQNHIEGEAVSVVDASGCYVTPGLIDHHAHLYPYAPIGIPAEAVCFGAGVTTAIDAGSCGCFNYEERRSFAAFSKLRIRAYMNVCSTGLDSLPVLEDVAPEHIDIEGLKRQFELYKGDELLGLKLRTSRNIVKEQGLEPLKAAVSAAEQLAVPLMVHITDPPTPLHDLIACLRPGDIITHMYQNIGFTILDDEKKAVQSCVEAARKRGVLFEAADARAHFSFEVSEPAIQSGFWPDFIATDLTHLSMHLRPTSFNLAMQVSKYCHLGIPFPEVIKRCTWNPAKDIKLEQEIGTLEVGKCADIAVFRPDEKSNVFGDRPDSDQTQSLRTGHLLYEPVLTVKSGEMVYRNLTF